MPAKLRAHLERWAERIDALSLRERALIFAAAALILVVALQALLLDPLAARRSRLLAELGRQEARAQALQAQIQIKAQEQARDPDAANRARRAALEARLGEVEKRLAESQRGWVSVKEMGDVLAALVSKNPGVRLMAVRTLPPATLGEGGAARHPASPTEQDLRAAVWRHGVEVVVEGGYADLARYCRAVESLPWQVEWGGMRLETVAWPQLKLTLTLYTLSLEDAWLSV